MSHSRAALWVCLQLLTVSLVTSIQVIRDVEPPQSVPGADSKAAGQAAGNAGAKVAAKPPPAPLNKPIKHKQTNKLSPAEQAQAQLSYLPAVYNSRGRDWGCCRICLGKDINKKMKLKAKPNDPSRLVNCCPVCPWPQTAKRKVGKFVHYFQQHPKSQNDEYEQELSHFKPFTQAEATALVPQSAPIDISKAHNPDPLLHKTSLLAIGTTTDSNPYANIYGKTNMERWENYVTGFSKGSSAQELDIPPHPDLPPCCNFCTRARDSLAVTGDEGCCMQCGMSYIGSLKHFPKRVFAGYGS